MCIPSTCITSPVRSRESEAEIGGTRELQEAPRVVARGGSWWRETLSLFRREGPGALWRPGWREAFGFSLSAVQGFLFTPSAPGSGTWRSNRARSEPTAPTPWLQKEAGSLSLWSEHTSGQMATAVSRLWSEQWGRYPLPSNAGVSNSFIPWATSASWPPS